MSSAVPILIVLFCEICLVILSCNSLFAAEGIEIRLQTSQLSLMFDNKTFKDFHSSSIS